MPDFVKSIFGSEGDVQGATSQDIDRAIEFIQEATGQAREDIFNIFPQSMENRLLGNEGALGIFNQSIPRQFNAFKEGNQQAQQTTAAGLPQQIAALMGSPYSLGGLQPKWLPQDPNFLKNATMPEFNTTLPDQDIDPTPRLLTKSGVRTNLAAMHPPFASAGAASGSPKRRGLSAVEVRSLPRTRPRPLGPETSPPSSNFWRWIGRQEWCESVWDSVLANWSTDAVF